MIASYEEMIVIAVCFFVKSEPPTQIQHIYDRKGLTPDTPTEFFLSDLDFPEFVLRVVVASFLPTWEWRLVHANMPFTKNELFEEEYTSYVVSIWLITELTWLIVFKYIFFVATSSFKYCAKCNSEEYASWYKYMTLINMATRISSFNDFAVSPWKKTK